MSLARHPVAAYMTAAPETVTPETPLADVAQRLASRRISAVAVVDARGDVIGVVSRWDLLHHRRRHPTAADVACSTVMSQGPLLIPLRAPLREAAQLLIEHRIHRLFVVDDGRLVGVLTTTDLARAVEDARVARPIDTLMTSPVVTIRSEQGLALAMEWLDRAHVTGLIVTEHDWPIGVFTQEDALAARDLPPQTEVGTLLDPSLICLPRMTAVHRAAAQCAAMGVRRVAVSDRRELVGVVSGLDFARVVAEA